jgi:hypothetical protein
LQQQGGSGVWIQLSAEAQKPRLGGCIAPAKRGRQWRILTERSKIKAIEDETLRGLTEQGVHPRGRRTSISDDRTAIWLHEDALLAKNGMQVMTLFALSNR